jgi:hypothetical protein
MKYDDDEKEGNNFKATLARAYSYYDTMMDFAVIVMKLKIL